ncbi:hypothetical protein A2331_03685 [Candidatus Falkowbacteria bacterium RIFOXYB2_FULL_34_18]|uniref:Uncharacterized protein n=1 Tax=Candidatus Falkowbacteria bacterium RIFOXYD2_FULL_34_120 TaxID=1798007 RepID=A0A1F5TSN5_9BACT|nr:MAG: hypothetical protein A2331_03685 [Candidatus Falkowbacteria bacterium RIFOXYB2_FULL_34_18]OGF30078.1 MAG: hypothetical protein A2500_04765 [Candidatus Falkowbacteria bacterium RIFOXYC12_FULL_34_55]OGF37588.1 MAG: hypothetical protein A2466_02080 [Candidatus Falkowbacteria bacterium RIFOXYC2_FULL_34_220]OGF39344.1 MAG: hypothetical protein A2515_02495 [Candidatus Falkowbacteria bacterium RIFOXYD12_FULL_34_57]OGF41849.1 MAG: hypothetical protein A2531_05480 [Candidatus Falkowbacteria bact
MLDKDVWKQIDNNSTGYMGKKRNEEWAKRNALYGVGNWQMGWLVEGNLLEYFEICEMYGEAYYAYFMLRPELMDHLVEVASDVYNYSPEDIQAGEDFSHRGDLVTHITDTVIRRCVNRFGRKFKGNKLLQIRDRIGPHPLSLALSPGQVPFNDQKILSFPDNLEELHKDAWWLPGSVEDFYQRAKRLCLKKEVLKQIQDNN